MLTGKWHPRPDPWNCGFSDVRVWLPGGGGPYTDISLAHGQSRATKVVKGYTQQIFADDAIDFLMSDAAKEKPFFLWLAFTAPHTPGRPNPERIEKLYAGKTNADLLPPNFPRGAKVKAKAWGHYYESVSYLDEQVGRLPAPLD